MTARTSIAALRRTPLLLALLVVPAPGCCGMCSPFSLLSGLGAERANDDDNDDRATATASTSRAARPAGSAVIEISAAKLIAAYEKPATADKTYGGRRVQTTGWIAEITEGTFANPAIMIGGAKGIDPLEDTMVQCRVTDAFVEAIGSLVIDSAITVVGDCEGERLGQVRLEECEIVTGGR